MFNIWSLFMDRVRVRRRTKYARIKENQLDKKNVIIGEREREGLNNAFCISFALFNKHCSKQSNKEGSLTHIWTGKKDRRKTNQNGGKRHIHRLKRNAVGELFNASKSKTILSFVHSGPTNTANSVYVSLFSVVQMFNRFRRAARFHFFCH